MRIIPHEEFNISTPMPKDEVVLRLRSNTKQVRTINSLFEFFKYDKTFCGDIYDNAFTITPIYNRNSFKPVIKGRISECEEGTVISVNMKLSAFVSVFMAVWLSMCALFFTLCLISMKSAGVFNAAAFIPLFMIGLGFFLMHVAFRSGARNSIMNLSRLVGGEYQTSRPINKNNGKA